MVFRRIPDFEYEISDTGVVRRLGGGERPIYQAISRDGYSRVSLWRGNRRSSLSVHRLVLSVFDRPPIGKEEANHKNGIRADNRIQNLEWCTGSENAMHARQGRCFGGGGHRKLSVEQVTRLRTDPPSCRELPGIGRTVDGLSVNDSQHHARPQLPRDWQSASRQFPTGRLRRSSRRRVN